MFIESFLCVSKYEVKFCIQFYKNCTVDHLSRYWFSFKIFAIFQPFHHPFFILSWNGFGVLTSFICKLWVFQTFYYLGSFG